MAITKWDEYLIHQAHDTIDKGEVDVNPNPGAVTVKMTYLPNGEGTPVSFTDEIPPGMRAAAFKVD